MTVRQTPILATLVFLAACGEPTQPGEPTFRIQHQVVFGLRHLPTTAEGGSRSIRFTGLFFLPTAGHTVTSALKVLAPRVLEVELTAVPTVPVVPSPTQNYYIGTIGQLGRGSYTLRVYHIVASTPSDTLLTFDAPVRVR